MKRFRPFGLTLSIAFIWLALACASSPYRVKSPPRAPLGSAPLVVEVRARHGIVDFMGTKEKYAAWMQGLVEKDLRSRGFAVEASAARHLRAELTELATKVSGGDAVCRLHVTLKEGAAEPKQVLFELDLEGRAKPRSKADPRRLGNVAAEECVTLLGEYLERER